MITSCPDQWPLMDAGIARNCTEDVTAPPVIDLTTGLAFRNTYCAICNNVSLEGIAVWRTKLYCTGPLNITTATIENYVSSYSACPFEKPINMELEPRSCFPHISSCPPQNVTAKLESEMDYHLFVDQCQRGPRSLAFASQNWTIYRNEYCAVCNGMQITHCFDPRDLPVSDACQEQPITIPGPGGQHQILILMHTCNQI